MTDKLPPLPSPVMNQPVGDDWEDLFTADQLRSYAEEAVRLERERVEKAALRMVNGRLVGPTLCDVPPEVLQAASRRMMEDPEYRAKILDAAIMARSEVAPDPAER